MFVAAASNPVIAHPAVAKKAAPMKTLRWYGLAGSAWPATLDPAEITDSISYNIANQIQGNLVTIEPNGVIAPTPGHPASCWAVIHGRCQVEYTSLAQSVTEAKNRLSFTFTLRPGLRF